MRRLLALLTVVLTMAVAAETAAAAISIKPNTGCSIRVGDSLYVGDGIVIEGDNNLIVLQTCYATLVEGQPVAQATQILTGGGRCRLMLYPSGTAFLICTGLGA